MKNSAPLLQKIVICSIVAILSAAWVTSCNNTLIPSSTELSVNDSSQSSPPVGLKASHGRSGFIQLSWQPSDGASRYYIYGTDKPTPVESDFIQVDQTPGTTISIKVKSGATAWYKIAAVDASGKTGAKSVAVRGSTLAKPEITEIKSEDRNDEINLSVQWYMENCFDETYKSFISYQICCKDESGNDFSTFVSASSLEKNSYTFDSLNPHTKYSIQVIATNNDFGDTEESLSFTEETLHRLRPNAPVNLTADFGIHKDKINLNFSLPQPADVYYSGDGSYQTIPIYFKVFKRNGPDDSWACVDEHFGTADSSDPVHPFKSVDGNPVKDYAEGTKIVWTDTISSANRGTKYEYKVQSYVDLTKLNEIKAQYNDSNAKNYSYMETSDAKSFSTAAGWAMSVPNLLVKNYQVQNNDDNPEYDGAHVGFSLIWDNFLLDDQTANAELLSKYKFVLHEKITPFSVDSKPAQDYERETFQNMSHFNSYERNFELPSERGKYTYKISIIEKNSGTEVDSAESAILVVTDNPGTIENFQVTGGYKDKFELCWKYDSNCSYSLCYTQTVDGVSDGMIYSVDISKATTSGSLKKFTDQTNISEAGVSRIYTLTAETKTSTSAPVSTTSNTVSSLGKPEIYFDKGTAKYDSITFKWKKLEGAESYGIEFDGKVKISNLSASDEKISTTKDSNGTVYCIYTLTPEDLGKDYFADATKSGLEKNITIKAKSAVDEVSNFIMANTLGPAGVGLETSVAENEKSITVRWNQVPGAKAYIVQRFRYGISGASFVKDNDSQDIFIVNGDDKSIFTSNGEQISDSSMAVSIVDGKFVLQDCYKPISESEKEFASQRQKTQSMIPWGIPMEYFVVPVSSTEDKFDKGILTSKSLASGKSLSYANYNSLTKKGSALGYGLNVHASKADSSSSVTVDWVKPYIEGKTNIRPYIYRRIKGSSSPFSESVGANISDSSVTNLNIPCTNSNLLYEPYEYAVKYINSDSDMQNPFVESYIENLSATKDSVSPTEQKNVGYPFAIQGFSANAKDSMGNESFTTTISWDSWNYTKKALGPDDSEEGFSYTIWTKNLNNAAGWYKIGTMDKNRHVSAIQENWYDAKIEASANCLALTPNGVTETSGENKGLLRVQRDQRQFYMIQAQRKNSSGATIYSYVGLDGSVFAYRKISAEEFGKNVLLIFADAMDQGGISSSGRRTCDGNTGYFFTEHPGAGDDFYYGTDGAKYNHKFRNLPGKLNPDSDESIYHVSSYNLSIPNTDKEKNACSYSKLYALPAGTVNVTNINNLPSYTGNLKIEKCRVSVSGAFTKYYKYEFNATATQSSGNSYTYAITTDESKNVTDVTSQVSIYFPFNMVEDRASRVTTYNESCYQYKANWWSPRNDSIPDSSFVDILSE